MGQLTVQTQQHNGLACITNIHFTEEDAIKELQYWIDRRLCGMTIEESFRDGHCVNIHVDDKDLKKIIKQGYLYAAFDYAYNARGFCVPLLIKASKTGLVKAFRAKYDPHATVHSMFHDCFNGAAFTLDKNNIPAGFSHMNFCGLKIY